jgi:hypothetical protein
MALTRAGRVVIWGAEGTNEVCAVPASASNGVAAIACGPSVALAVKHDGTFLRWGDKSVGQLDLPLLVTAGRVIKPTGGMALGSAIVASDPAADSDGDGVPDDWEMLHGGRPLVADGTWPDQDGDGFDDREEFLADTNPRDTGSRLAAGWSAQAPGAAIAVTSTNRLYQLWSTGDLTARPQAWTPAGPPQAGTGAILELVDPAAAADAVYRVSAAPVHP